MSKDILPEHFAVHVLPCIAEKLSDLADKVLEEIFNPYDSHRTTLGATKDEISGVAYSGFIPLQEGGYEVRDFATNGLSCGSFLSDGERIHTEQLERDCFKDFLEKFGYSTEPDELSDDAKENYYDFQNEWFMEEDTLIQFECWTQNSNIYLLLQITYKDTPYYRNQYAETRWEKTMTHSEFMDCDLIELVGTITK